MKNLFVNAYHLGMLIVLVISEFPRGVKNGIKYVYHEDLFNQKVPMWACWIIGLALVPFNIVFLIILLGYSIISKDYRALKEIWEDSVMIGQKP